MIRRIVLLGFLLWPLAALSEPQLRVEMEETETIPGQPLVLRMTVLVPTYMPNPPVWPSFEQPNLLVRLPEGSTSPTTERIDGETWSGISRRYRIAPMVPGEFTLPPQEVVVTWADPETNEPVKTTLASDPLSLTGVVPPGAETLDPFIAATALTLEGAVSGEPASMTPGDSVTLTLTAEVEGVSPMFLPKLLPAITLPGLAAYPDEPVVSEREERGKVSGTRVESVTFVAEGGGGGSVPGVSVDWFDIGSGEVETATAEGFEIRVDGPPAASTEPRDWRLVALLGAAGLIVALLAGLALRRLWPPLQHWRRARRAAWLGSERHAWGELESAVNRRDHAALRPALDLWAARCEGPDPREDARVTDALLKLGAARYSDASTTADEPAVWTALSSALKAARGGGSGRDQGAALPPLNPVSAG